MPQTGGFASPPHGGFALINTARRFVRSHWQMHPSQSNFRASTPLSKRRAGVDASAPNLWQRSCLRIATDADACDATRRNRAADERPASKDDVKSPDKLRMMAAQYTGHRCGAVRSRCRRSATGNIIRRNFERLPIRSLLDACRLTPLHVPSIASLCISRSRRRADQRLWRTRRSVAHARRPGLA